MVIPCQSLQVRSLQDTLGTKLSVSIQLPLAKTVLVAFVSSFSAPPLVFSRRAGLDQRTNGPMDQWTNHLVCHCRYRPTSGTTTLAPFYPVLNYCDTPVPLHTPFCLALGIKSFVRSLLSCVSRSGEKFDNIPVPLYRISILLGLIFLLAVQFKSVSFLLFGPQQTIQLKLQ